MNIGKPFEKEVDFVRASSNDVTYYLVAVFALDEATLNQELDPFREINDNHPKILLALDQIGAGDNYDDIRQYNLIDYWPLDE